MDPIRDLLLRRFPGWTVDDTQTIGADVTKRLGYGNVVRVALRDPAGSPHAVVFHTARADEFGHDRRADRAAEMLLAFDTYGQLPRHVPALDVGVIAASGELRSIADATEMYLLTGWAEGEVYANDLRRIAREGATARDELRLDVLADYLRDLHVRLPGRELVYTRAVRDLVGSGEGVFGIVDGYPADVPAAPPDRLRRLEERCLGWRWKLRGREARVARTHGDFHPFNLVFAGDAELSVLDASRGAAGDPADDLAALAINFVFFALDAPGAWERGLGPLWHRLWMRYLHGTHDTDLLDVIAPWLTWRALVIANPKWYPDLSRGARDTLLRWVQDALETSRFDPMSAEELFR